MVKTRRTLVVVVVLALLISLLGVESLASEWPLEPIPRELVVTEWHGNQPIELEPRQLLVLRLQSNPSTGYRWEVQEMDHGVLQQVGETEFEPQSDLLGAPATQVLRFAGVGRGQTILRLGYRRSWEQGVPPVKMIALPVQARGPFAAADTTEPASAGVDAPAEQTSSSLGLPIAFNWCDQGGCTPVKNQGSCGSCWAFGTVGPVESAILIKDGVTKDLSEQYLVSCNTEGWGCNGGWWAHDYYEWKIPPGEPDAGAVYESDFLYKALDLPCNPPHTHYEKLADWATLAYGVAPVDAIKQAIYDYGPVSTALCVNSAFQSYNGGVFSGPSCTSVNHAVTIVGWDDTLGSSGAWRIKNSWGTSWGENGYMWIEYGVSQVGYRTAYVVYNGGQNQPPVASFSYDCTGLDCTFDASNSSDPDGSIVSYSWDFGDGNTSSGVTASNSYDSAGSYTVVLTVTDDDSATGTDTQNVSVSDAVTLHVGGLDGSTSGNKKFWWATVTVTAHDNSHNPVANVTVHGTWSGGASGTSSCLTDGSGQCSATSSKMGQSDPSATFAVDSMTHASLTYEPADNHETSITVSQGGNQAPVASFTYDCLDLTCAFDASGSSDDRTIASYHWEFGDGSWSDAGVTASHTYASAGTYGVVLTVTDDGGAMDTATQTIPVGVDPTMMFVSNIEMVGQTAGINRSATAAVTIYDGAGNPVEGATVYGIWSGDYASDVSGVTGADGTVSFTSGKVRQANATFTFTVDNVVKSGYVYDESRDVEPSDTVVVP